MILFWSEDLSLVMARLDLSVVIAGLDPAIHDELPLGQS
jgi:hypothetical protein